MNEINTMHLFAGHGGGLLADLILGHKPIVAVEWDKYACQVLRERAADGWFPGLHVWEGDVRLFDPSEYTGRVDCIHSGFPCQDISVAGKQAGLGEGTRSGLYREVLRIAGVVRPKQLFLENVSAIRSNGLGTVLGDLAALGYDSRWLCIRASDVGAPHHRDRWFLLAERTGFSSHAEHIGDGRGEQQQEGTSEAPEMADAAGESANGHAVRAQAAHPLFGIGCEDVADTDSAQRQGNERTQRGETKHTDFGGAGWWQVESDVGRVADGLSNRVHRLKGLGNAQVPLQAATAYSLLQQR